MSGLPQEIVEIFGGSGLESLLEGESEDVNLQQFGTFLDWLTVLLLMGTEHALPQLDDKAAVDLLEIVARRIALPGFKNRWDWARRWINRVGKKQVIARIKIEFDRTYHGEDA